MACISTYIISAFKSNIVENLAMELNLANDTKKEKPLNGAAMKKSILNDKNRTNSFSSEPRCEDHPPIFGTKGDL